MKPIVSPLFVPGDRPERFAKAAETEADAVILDLEDAVAPAAKALARRNIAGHGLGAKPVIVRINAFGTPWWDEDVAMLRRLQPAGVLLAKAEGSEAAAILRRELGEAVAILPLVESVRGLDTLDQVLGAPGVLCAAFGSIDLALDLGCDPEWEPLLFARSMLITRSRLAGLPAPLDGVTAAVGDPDLAGREAARARSFGFGGKLVVHPRQLGPVRAAFLPSETEIAWARAVVRAAETGAGAVQVDGAMLDKPIFERARRILDRL